MINQKIAIGKILKCRGLKGELKVDIYSRDFTNIKQSKSILIDDKEFKVINCNVNKNFAYLNLDSVNSLETAIEFKNKEIYLLRNNFIKLPKNRYYVVDLIGCSAIVESKVVGEIVDVYNENKRDVYVIRGNKKMYVPIIDNLILEHNLGKKQILFDSSLFYSVMVEN